MGAGCEMTEATRARSPPASLLSSQHLSCCASFFPVPVYQVFLLEMPLSHLPLALSFPLLSSPLCCARAQLLSSIRPHGLEPARLLCPWDSPGKDAGVGCHFLPQRTAPTLRLEPVSPALQADSLTLPTWEAALTP